MTNRRLGATYYGRWPAPVGTKISFSQGTFTSPEAGRVPQGVLEHDFFNGAVLAILLRENGKDEILGTAVMLAPGLAVSAAHVVVDHLQEGKRGILFHGTSNSGLQLWEPTSVRIPPNSDLCLFSIWPCSTPPSNWHIMSFPITTRTPRAGQRVTIVGFQMPTSESSNEGRNSSHKGDLYAASGNVEEFLPEGRGNLLPGPVFHIECGSLGGMSGGAVLDDTGAVMGVLSRGMESDENDGPSYGEWIVPSLTAGIALEWPPGVYPQPTCILDITSTFGTIHGRDMVRNVGGAVEWDEW